MSDVADPAPPVELWAPALTPAPDLRGCVFVYFEPEATVVRVFGRLGPRSWPDVLSASVAVVRRGGPVDIRPAGPGSGTSWWLATAAAVSRRRTAVPPTQGSLP